jgi:hypothetical protein
MSLPEADQYYNVQNISFQDRLKRLLHVRKAKLGKKMDPESISHIQETESCLMPFSRKKFFE